MAINTLFRCATLEDWTDVMYINMYGCKDYGYDDDDYTQRDVIVAFVAIAIGACAVLAFIRLMVCVIVESYQGPPPTNRDRRDSLFRRAYAPRDSLETEVTPTRKIIPVVTVEP